MATFPNLVGPSATTSSLMADCERTVNLYPERIEAAGAKPAFPWCLLPTPGFTPFATLPKDAIRGLFPYGNSLFVVAGDGFYEVDALSAAQTLHGAVALGGVPSFACSGALSNELVIASGGNLYRWKIDTGVFSLVLATPEAASVAFLDDRFIALNAAQNQFRVSALLDASTWPAGTAVAARSVAGDTWQALLVSHRQLWLMGQLTSESWYDAGNDPDQPFAQDPSSVMQYGIGAQATLCEHDNAPMWLGQTKDGQRVFYRAEGYTPQRISTHAVEVALQGYSTVADAVAYTEQYQGHSFYTCVFPLANACWSYDAASGQWHERGDWSPAQNQYLASRAICHCYAAGKHFVGDRLSGTIYVADPTVATAMDGTGIRRLRRTPHLSSEQALIFITRLQLDLDVGGGLPSGQGSDPMIMLRASKDGGRTWGNERWITAGQLGKYGTRAIWNSFGAGRDWVFEIVVSDPVISAAKWVQAFVTAQVGTN